ncbi:MAG TPA: 3-hydroxyacyl-CoA dehydrogenase [Enteractinococcus helveticum]|uniref:3-hydroxyacyl-CoA dehydrogenase n=1 Tax=Enteractinococcus helveticum TaxID=1837282 RepID=A0A921K8L7_9MICC|nr:3-hydroxyacyl-CoA dehydrogenase [Enteractinococcus helveticum]HJF15877.1 3-hydroxyacyl-CoA dehydrogenase [Enteractinococcus helveticum]
MDNQATIAIIGGGSIGVAFAVVFARAGATVRIQEPALERRDAVLPDITRRLQTLDNHGLLEDNVATITQRIQIVAELAEAVADADLVQECIPENLEFKQQLFTKLADLTEDTCVIASSTSFIPSSQSSADTGVADRTLVAHPGNPPYAIPVIELVPNPQTRNDIIQRAEQLYTAAGMSPIRVQQEIEGFVFNRLQGALLREAYALVRDGIASVEDIDTVVRDGLGRRWAFMGPFETVDLNTRGGIANHAKNMGPSYHRMGLERGDTSVWTTDLVAEVVAQRRQQLDLSDWEDRVSWRDEQLLARIAQQHAGTKESL